MRLYSLWLLLLVHSFGLSSASKPDADGIDVICTSNKNNTGNCRSSNNVDGPSTLLACTNVSSDLIECSRSSAGLLVHYDCVKSLSISNYQKLFSCQENSSSGNVDVNQFIADEDGSDVLSSGPKHNNKRLLAEGKLDESSADSASKIFIDAINMNIIDTNTSSPASSASDSFANGF
jgi:hypothetical protein